MSNNFQMFQYDGSQYNQLVPNHSNIATNSTQLGGVDSTLYATKEYVNEIDPLFTKHKKVATVSSYDNVYFSSQIEAKKIISIIYKINDFSASIENGKSEESNASLYIYFTYNSSSIGSFEVIKSMKAKDIKINTIVQKPVEFYNQGSPLFLRDSSNNGLIFDGFNVSDAVINGAYLNFDNRYFLFRSGNIEVWVRTIDD